MTRNMSKRLRMRGWLYHRLYNELAWAYDSVSWMVSLGQWQAWRNVALEYVSGERVVEVGFGTGELLLELAARGVQVCGIDLSSDMHRITTAKLLRRGRRTPLPVQPGLVQAAIQHLPLASGSVDTLITTFPAEFIGQARTWQELGRASYVLRLRDRRRADAAWRWVSTSILTGAHCDGPLASPTLATVERAASTP